MNLRLRVVLKSPIATVNVLHPNESGSFYFKKTMEVLFIKLNDLVLYEKEAIYFQIGFILIMIPDRLSAEMYSVSNL